MSRSKSILPAVFYPLLFFVGIGTFFVHELAHWLAGVALGYEMVATPNRVWSKTEMSVKDLGLVLAAGPAITILQGILGLCLVRTRRSLLGFALLYMAFFMRVVAAGISFFNPNDEARISQLLGLGTWTVPLIVVVGLFVVVVYSSLQLKLTLRDQFFCYLVASIVVTLVVGADMMFWPQA